MDYRWRLESTYYEEKDFHDIGIPIYIRAHSLPDTPKVENFEQSHKLATPCKPLSIRTQWLGHIMIGGSAI